MSTLVEQFLFEERIEGLRNTLFAVLLKERFADRDVAQRSKKKDSSKSEIKGRPANLFKDE